MVTTLFEPKKLMWHFKLNLQVPFCCNFTTSSQAHMQHPMGVVLESTSKQVCRYNFKAGRCLTASKSCECGGQNALGSHVGVLHQPAQQPELHPGNVLRVGRVMGVAMIPCMWQIVDVKGITNTQIYTGWGDTDMIYHKLQTTCTITKQVLLVMLHCNHYSGTPPCGHPWNTDIHCNADTVCGPKRILRILTYISNPWNADNPLYRNADSKYGPNDTVTLQWIFTNPNFATRLCFGAR